MLARVFSCAVIGLDGVIVEVEVDTAQGLPGMDMLGYPLPEQQPQSILVRFLLPKSNLEYQP